MQAQTRIGLSPPSPMESIGTMEIEGHDGVPLDPVPGGVSGLLPSAAGIAVAKETGMELVHLHNVPKSLARIRLACFPWDSCWSLPNGLLRVLIIKDLLRGT
jgi:hypothetical protein